MTLETTAETPASAPPGEAQVTEGNAVFYLNGRRMIETASSVPVSSSRWLNDARVREWISTESLRRNGHDYPLLFGLPTLMQATDQVRDSEAAERLSEAERAHNPVWDRFVGEGFVSRYTKDDLAAYPAGSAGRLLFEYMDEYDLSSELNSRILADPQWKPANTLDFWNLRMGQTHDLYHILGEVGFGCVSEYFITGVITGNTFRHLSADLAGALMTVNTLIMFPWMTRTMLHYPGAWPELWNCLSYGYEVGRQSDPLFAVHFEDILALTPAEAREQIGWRGHRGKLDTRVASEIFGEGREIIP